MGVLKFDVQGKDINCTISVLTRFCRISSVDTECRQLLKYKKSRDLNFTPKRYKLKKKEKRKIGRETKKDIRRNISRNTFR